MKRMMGIIGIVCVFVIVSLKVPAQSARLLPFQGRLTDSAGNPVADGPYKIQFKIFDAPTGGDAKWDGEIHTATVNGGLVNVILGTKAPFGDSFTFSQILYLDITVDVNGDKVINESDPPMLPRQRIVPVIYSQEAGRLEGNRWQEFFLHPDGKDPARDPSKSRSKDAAKLKDLEWTDFFTSEDPANAKSKDADKLDGIDSAAIFVDPANVTSPKVKIAALADSANNVNVSSLVGQIPTESIADDAITSPKIADHAVTSSKLEEAKYKIATFKGSKTIKPEDGRQDVPGLEVTFTSHGRPVLIQLSANYLGETYQHDNQVWVYSGGYIYIMRDGNDITSWAGGPAGQINGVFYPVNTTYIDFPPAGEHTYKVQIHTHGGEMILGLGTEDVEYKLTVIEL